MTEPNCRTLQESPPETRQVAPRQAGGGRITRPSRVSPDLPGTALRHAVVLQASGQLTRLTPEEATSLPVAAANPLTRREGVG